MPTLVVGLDGATFDVMQPLLEAGRLPTLSCLKAAGVWGTLESVVPPESAQAWSSFLTGNNPGRHGILGFTRRVPGQVDRELSTSRHRAGPDLSELLSRQGKRVGLFNVPLTYPPRPTAGFTISGMGTPGLEAQFAEPPELREELLREFGDRLSVDPDAVGMGPEAYLDELHASIDRTSAVGSYLLDRFAPLDVAVVVFMAADRVQHFFWHQSEVADPLRATDGELCNLTAISEIYEHLDAAVGRLIEHREGWHAVVLSDHGAGPIHRLVHLNRWLAGEGYLRFRDPPGGPGRTLSTLARSPVLGLYRAYARRLKPTIPRRYRGWLRRHVPAGVLRRVRGYRHSPVLAEIDWQRTQAYALGGYGCIALNLIGRDAQGCVPEAERERLVAEIADRLMDLRDPEPGRPAVARVWRSEELYWGPFADRAPELVVEWRDPSYHVARTRAAKGPVFGHPSRWQFSELFHSGNHRRHGVLLMHGPGIRQGRRITGSRLFDMAPTLMYLTGASVPTGLDGIVLEDAFTAEALERRPVAYHKSEGGSGIPGDVPGLSDGEESALRDRLKALGYLE
jgi:predicted AlkP superfamily phosphohydrolase/phosphomutase